MDQAQQLRNVVKLKNQNNENTARVITITSGKGGVGKSNVAVNLPMLFSTSHVVLFMCDKEVIEV